mmetsp:Transcript_7605/g.22287  ORF Transcript_7605/g.22287 Transcript_7605/m.22287 type:complete len:219 (+) Transcript_7605:4045-4701(+)
MDSSIAVTEGEIVAIKHVLHLPPRLSCRIRVSFESLYGIRTLLLLLLLLLLPPAFPWLFSLRSLTTRPRVNKDLLMFMRSRSRAACCLPAFPHDLAHSLPARSTQWSFPATSSIEPSTSWRLASTLSVKMQCDREDSLFMSVSPVWRCRCAICISSSKSEAEVTLVSDKPRQNGPFSPSMMASFVAAVALLVVPPFGCLLWLWLWLWLPASRSESSSL